MPDPESVRYFLTIVSLIWVGLSIFKPTFGVMGYLTIMILRPGLYFPEFAAYRVELIVGVIALLVSLLNGGLQRIMENRLALPGKMFLIYGVMLVSMVQAMDFTVSYDWMWEFSKVLAFFIMVLSLLKDEKDVELFIWTFGLITIMIAYEAIYNSLQGLVVERGEMNYAIADKGYGSGHVALANMCLQAAPFFWYMALNRESSFAKMISIVIFGICLGGTLVAGSRGGMVGIVAMFGMMVYFSENRGPLIALGICVGLIAPFFGSEGYLEYMKSILAFGSDKADVSASSRIAGLRHGIEMMIHRPLLGVGPGCYPIARKMWFGWGLWAHNLYGEIAGDLGMIGIIVWFSFLYRYIKAALVMRLNETLTPISRNILTGIVVATGVRLVLGMGSHSLYVFFWYIMAAMVVVFAYNIPTPIDLDSKEKS